MEDGKIFEIQVLQIARFLWPEGEISGSIIYNGKERDGVFITEDVIHLLEVTVSKSLDKTRYDLNKLIELRDHYREKYSEKLVKCWFITKNEPTADQRSISEDYRIITLSFLQFQSKLFNAKDYLFKRDTHSFGSVRDPNTDTIKFEDKYIPNNLVSSEKNHTLSISNITSALQHKSEKFVILGHFGVGKSLTCYEAYRQLKYSYLKNKTDKFPIFLNLREHDGQKNPSEALIRHASNIGFENPNSLVSAWKLGYVILILDGLDEMAPFSWADHPSKLRSVRYNTMTLIRQFISESPQNTGILISGRINYFDSEEECLTSLGNNEEIEILSLQDFTEQQAVTYLKEKNISIIIPDWFPARPLLISYLVSKNLLIDKILNNELDAASGWDWLLDKITEREARLENGIDPKTIREIIERLASFCRTLGNNLGPITEDIISKVFNEVVGYNPYSDNRALTLLQRLPGLSAPNIYNGGNRSFIDENLVQVAAAGQVFKYILNPYNKERVDNPNLWKETLNDLGIATVTHLLNKKSVSSELLFDAFRYSKKYDSDILPCDILLIINEEDIIWNRGDVSIEDVIISHIDIKPDILKRIRFKEVIVKNMSIEGQPAMDTFPIFEDSIILFVSGVHNNSMLPIDRFINCNIEKFDDFQETNTAILNRDDLSTCEKVGMSILRKLYFQAGGGRQEKSLKRGLPPKQVIYVDIILELLEKERLVFKSKGNASNRIWVPIRSKTNEVEEIVRLKNKNNQLFKKLRDIN
jgi:hypothetical protein